MSLLDTGYDNYANRRGGLFVANPISSSSATTQAIEPGYNNFGVQNNPFNFTNTGLISNPAETPTVVSSSGTPGGSDTQVQFNDGGSFGGSSYFTFNKLTATIVSTGMVAADGIIGQPGSSLDFQGGTGGATNQKGGDITIKGGTGGSLNGDGGHLFIESGDYSGSGNAGNLYIRSGIALGGGDKGIVFIGNASQTGNGGFPTIPIFAGAPTGTPAANGAMCYDRTNNKFYIYNGGWKSATFS